MAPRLITAVLAIGFVFLLGVSLPPFLSGGERTLTFASQDFPFDNTTSGGGLSKAFWLSASEWIRPELVERISNRSTGAFLWQGPAYFVFLHYAPNESGPAIPELSTAPRDAFYALEVHHHDCQVEVDLCLVARTDLSYQTSGTLRIVSPRPYPFLAPYWAVLIATGSVAGLGLVSWRLARWRYLPLDKSGFMKGAPWRRVAVVTLLAIALVVAGFLGVDSVYRARVSAQANGFGVNGFAADQPCVSGQSNMMTLYISAYNGADEALTIWVEVLVRGSPARVTGIVAHGHSSASFVAGIYSSTDCKDPAAQVRVNGIWPSWG
jgi:hypothetical protein